MKRAPILLTVVSLIVVGTVVAILGRPKNAAVNANVTVIPKRCAEELKFCPDGSVVGRVLPACEFTPCPGSGTEAAFTEGWKEYVSTADRFTLRHPADWSARTSGPETILSGDGRALTLQTTEDDAALWVGQNHFAIPVGGVVSTQADTVTPEGTTRTVWIPRGAGYLIAAWQPGTDDAVYYQVLSTLRLTE